MHLKFLVICFLLGFCLFSCRDEVLPKPKAMLRLEYEVSETRKFETDLYQFRINTRAIAQQGENKSMTIDYPKMKGSIFITYKPVEDNLERLLSDAQKLSYEHVVKADNIVEQPFLNENDRVYGMYYEVMGDAASQAQFYVTDSTKHFLTGSLYFYARPNYDSIYPAAVYLQSDIRQIMETLKWKK